MLREKKIHRPAEKLLRFPLGRFLSNKEFAFFRLTKRDFYCGVFSFNIFLIPSKWLFFLKWVWEKLLLFVRKEKVFPTSILII